MLGETSLSEAAVEADGRTESNSQREREEEQNQNPDLWTQMMQSISSFALRTPSSASGDDVSQQAGGRHYHELGEFDPEGEANDDDDDDDDDSSPEASEAAGTTVGDGGKTRNDNRRQSSAPEILDSWWEIERALLNVTSKLFARLNISAFSVEGISALDPIALAIVWQRQNNHRSAIKLAREQNIVEQPEQPDIGTLRNLLQASRYSCAAYGTSLQHIAKMSDIIENGFFANSFRNLDSLVEDSLAPIKTTEDACPSNHDDVIEILLPNSKLLHSDWNTGMFSPSSYIAVDHEYKWVVLAVRGTFHSSDALTDACADEAAFLNGWAHAGMCAAAWNMTAQQLPKLALALHQNPGYELITTGHSMGGGVAALFTMLLHSDDSDVEKAAIAGLSEGFDPTSDLEFNLETILETVKRAKCYTIASPSLVSLNLSMEAESFITSAICGKDIVPRLSIDNVKNLVDQLVGAAPLNRTINAMKKVGEIIGGNASSTSLEEDSNNEFELRNHSSSSFMVPPGRVIHLRHLNAESGPVSEIRHPTAFTQIQLSPRMFLDHFPTIYTSILQRICDLSREEGKKESEEASSPVK